MKHLPYTEILRALLSVLSVLLLLCACRTDPSSPADPSSAAADPSVLVYDGGTTPLSPDTLSAYTITRGDTCGDTAMQAAITLRKAIEPHFAIGLTTDFVNERRGEMVPEDNFEINDKKRAEACPMGLPPPLSLSLVMRLYGRGRLTCTGSIAPPAPPYRSDYLSRPMNRATASPTAFSCALVCFW